VGRDSYVGFARYARPAVDGERITAYRPEFCLYSFPDICLDAREIFLGQRLPTNGFVSWAETLVECLQVLALTLLQGQTIADHHLGKTFFEWRHVGDVDTHVFYVLREQIVQSFVDRHDVGIKGDIWAQQPFRC